MSMQLLWVILIYCVNTSMGLICYNCSVTNHNLKNQYCAGFFAPPFLAFNNSRVYAYNCTGDNAMCFVRSWRARAKHAWIVQRGCYLSEKNDAIPRAMSNPTRAMTCTNRRLSDAEYKLCLCTANWCNSATLNFVSLPLYLTSSVIGALAYAFNI